MHPSCDVRMVGAYESLRLVFVLLRKDKRREVGTRTHAAARAREDAADGLDMKEADTMGGGDSFHETLARAKYGKQRRQTAKTVRLCVRLLSVRACISFCCACRLVTIDRVLAATHADAVPRPSSLLCVRLCACLLP